MQITALESRQLLAHLNASPSWYCGSDARVWLNEQNGSALVIQPSKDNSDDFDASEVPNAVGDLPTGGLLLSLLRTYTDYHRRSRIARLLRERCSLSEADADAVSRAMLSADESPNADSIKPFSRRSDGVIGTYPILGGGYVHLELSAGRILVTLSLPRKQAKQLAFPPSLTGILSSADGRSHDIAAALAGWSD